MRLKTKELLREWEWAKKFVEKKTSIPILSNIAISQCGDSIGLFATNLEIMGSTVIPAVSTTSDMAPLSIAAPAKMVYDYLKMLDTEEIDICADAASPYVLQIKSGSTVGKFQGMSTEGFPAPLKAPEATVELRGVNVEFPRALACISTEESRFTLNGARLFSRGPNEGTFLISTDGHRLSYIELKTEPGAAVNALICKDALDLAASLNDGHVWFGCNSETQLFFSGKRNILARPVTGSFPDWERVLPRDYPGWVTFDAARMRRELARVAHFADQRSAAVRMDISPGASCLRLNAYEVDRGAGYGEVPATIHGAGVEAGVNARYLMDFLQRVEGEVRIAYKDGRSALDLVSADGWRYVLMLMRI